MATCQLLILFLARAVEILLSLTICIDVLRHSLYRIVYQSLQFLLKPSTYCVYSMHSRKSKYMNNGFA